MEKLQKFANDLIHNRVFESFILAVIIANSIILALADYSHVDDEGNLIEEGSTRNMVVNRTDLFFLILYTIELVLKSLALTPLAYVRDSWNWIDFIVVITGWISMAPNIKSVINFVRAFRLLRPLKSASVFPGLAHSIKSMLHALAGLRDVMVLILALFIGFGIIGLQAFSGPYMHARCRLTPYPVTHDWHHGLDYEHYRCLDVPNFSVLDKGTNKLNYRKEDSPWAEPQEHCHWPLSEHDERLCGLTPYGMHQCINHVDSIPEEEWTWCGSDYDAYGNHRFGLSFDESTFTEHLRFNTYNFDNIGKAFLIVFQTLTRNGWHYAMYSTMNAFSPLAALYFVGLIVIGAYVILELVVAMLEESISETKMPETEPFHLLNSSFIRACQDKLRSCIASLDSPFAHRVSDFTASIAHNKWYMRIVAFLIFVNTIILAVDHYPDTNEFSNVIDFLDYMLTMGFFVDMIITMTSLGVFEYLSDSSHCMDMVIVLLSFSYAVANPVPAILLGHPLSSYINPSGSVSSLRSFRLFRLFRLFRSRVLKSLVVKIFDCFSSMFSFIFLLFLYLFVFSTMGEMIFANKFRFTHEGHVIKDIHSEKWDEAAAHHETFPRSNFDDFSHSLATIFQMMTEDEMGEVLVNCGRSQGAAGIIFSIIVVTIGTFVIANLFLALLIHNFLKDSSVESSYIEHGMLPEGAQIEMMDMKEEKDSESGEAHDAVAPLPVTHMKSNEEGSVHVHDLEAGKSATHDAHHGRVSVRQHSQQHFEEDIQIQHLSSVVMSYSNALVNVGKELPVETEVIAGAAPKLFKRLTTKLAVIAKKRNSVQLDPIQLDPIPTEPTADNNEADQLTVQSTDRKSDKYSFLPNHDPVEEVEVDRESVQAARVEFADTSLSFPSPEDAIPSLEDMHVVGKDDEEQKFETDGDMGEAVAPSMKTHVANELADAAKMVDLGQKVFSNKEEGESILPLTLVERAKFIINHHIFDSFIFCLIVVSCVSLALDNPLLDPESQLVKSLAIIDTIVTIAFAIEMILKMIVFGVSCRSGTYFFDPWNWPDFVVVVTSLLYIFGSDAHLHQLKGIRALRVFRPLRLIQKLPGLKKILGAVFACLPEVLDVALILLLILFVFSIFFVSYLKGQFRSCQGHLFEEGILHHHDAYHLLVHPEPWHHLSYDHKHLFSESHFPTNTSHAHLYCAHDDHGDEACCYSKSMAELIMSVDVPTSRMYCECWGAEWLAIPGMPTLFDNIPRTVVGLFQISAGGGWVKQMYGAVDSRGIDMEPIRDYNPAWIYVFIFFILISTYLGVNLFVSIITESFQKHGNGDEQLLTKGQMEWAKTKRLISSLRPAKELRPHFNHVFFQRLFDFCRHPLFEYAILILLLFQMAVLMMLHFGESDQVTEVLVYSEYVIALAFVLEAVLKITGYGPVAYFHSNWNRFDAIIAAISFIGVVILFVTGNSSGLYGNFIRVLRLAKLLRSVSGTVRDLLNALYVSLPYIGNIVMLLLLGLYMFSVVAVNLFAKIEFHKTYNEEANFRSFGLAILTLFRFITDDTWGHFMQDVSYKSEGCVDDPKYDPHYCGFHDSHDCEPLNGCGNVGIYPFMFIYIMVMFLMMLNIFVGVIVFEWGYIKKITLKPDHLQSFLEHWSKFDPHAYGYIEFSQLEDFVGTLCSPLGFGGRKFSRSSLQRRIGKIKIYKSGHVYFSDLMMVLSASCYERMSHAISMFRTEEQLKKDKTTIFNLDPHPTETGHHTIKGRVVSIANQFHSDTIYPMAEYVMVGEQPFTIDHLFSLILIQEACRKFIAVRRNSKSISIV